MNITTVVAALVAAAELGTQGAPMHDVARTLAETDLPVFPCDPKTKQPLTPHGFKDRTTDLAQIAAWWSEWPNAAPGMVPGDAGMAALDVDSPAAFAAARGIGAIPADFLNTLRTRQAGQPLAPECGLIIETGGASAPFEVSGVTVPPHHVYTYVNGAKPPHIKGLVVRYDKGYVIAPGARVRKVYTLLARGAPTPYTPPPEPAPEVRPTPTTDLDPARVRAALMALPNTGDEFADREKWIGVAHMLRGTLDDAGRALWIEWCAQYPKANPDEDARVFDTLPSSQLGWPALAGLASQYGFSVTPAERAALAQTAFAPIPGAVAAPPPARTINTGHTLRELMDQPELLRPPAVVIPKLAWAGQKTLLSGREKIGKSTLLFAGFSAATRGDNFLSESTTPQRVLVLTEEALVHPVRRAVAMKADPDRVRIVPMEMDPRAQLREAVAKWQPTVVLIDTLYRYAGVEDENASGVWHPIFAELDVLTRHGITLVLSAHANKRSEHGEYRGSSALGAFVDVILETYAPHADSVVRHINGKGRIPVDRFAVKYDKATSTFALLSEEAQCAADANAVREFLSPAKSATKSTLKDELHMGTPRLNAALTKLGPEVIKEDGEYRLRGAADDFTPEGSAV